LVWDEHENLQGFMALEMDITQRKESEKLSERQQDMMESMSRQGAIVAWEMDLVPREYVT
jgi:hypothetical protein